MLELDREKNHQPFVWINTNVIAFWRASILYTNNEFRSNNNNQMRGYEVVAATTKNKLEPFSTYGQMDSGSNKWFSEFDYTHFVLSIFFVSALIHSLTIEFHKIISFSPRAGAWRKKIPVEQTNQTKVNVISWKLVF